MLVDFKPSEVNNDNITPSPDVIGNYWNNVLNSTAGEDIFNLTDKQNQPSGIYGKVVSGFLTNGIQNGGLLAPSNALLEEYAIAAATQDCFSLEGANGLGRLRMGGFAANNRYAFHSFGSRQAKDNRVTQNKLLGRTVSTVSQQTIGSAIGNNNYSGNNNSITPSDILLADANWINNLEISKTTYINGSLVWSNATRATVGEVFLDGLSLQSYEPLNELKIVYFGSSVPHGTGATNRVGYTSLYTNILRARSTQQLGLDWQTTNISVPGDNTVRVMNRWQSDLLPQKAKYVIYALALGNEGIHEFGQPRFDQFSTNLQQLIRQARDKGMVPVITNNYTRNDYNATDYAFIQQMNLLIHSWDVPSVNLLGAVDDGAGRWATGFWDDALHPNDAGHAEMAYTLVPSLFDALAANKPQPKKVEGSHITLASSKAKGSKSLVFTPENVVHSFTSTVSFKASKAQALMRITEAGGGVGVISTDASGKVMYRSPKTGRVTSTGNVHDGKWHKISLTHYYARGETILYIDSVQAGSLSEKLIPTQFKLSGNSEPKQAKFRNWTFHRAGMTREEIYRLVADSVLKSSLEIYAPLDGKRVGVSDSLVNLAQSLNTLRVTSEPLGFNMNRVKASGFRLFPNLTAGEIDLSSSKEVEGSQVLVPNLVGRQVFTRQVQGSKINISDLAPGMYSLVPQKTGKDPTHPGTRRKGKGQQQTH